MQVSASLGHELTYFIKHRTKWNRYYTENEANDNIGVPCRYSLHLWSRVYTQSRQIQMNQRGYILQS
jgi:hypothetical protein